MDTKPDEEIISEVYNLVFSSTRPMPAYFCSDSRGRTKSFCIDFNDLTEENEYHMASVAYNVVENFIEQISNTAERTWIVKLAEDAIIGSYIITKIGYPYLAFDLEKSLTSANIEGFRNKSDDFDVNRTYCLPGIREYLDYCVKEGCRMALTGELREP